jgi:hypothetical protein
MLTVVNIRRNLLVPGGTVGHVDRLPARLRNRVRFLTGAGYFSFSTVSKRALGPTQPPLQWKPLPVSLGVKWPEREADFSPPSSADLENAGAVPPLTPAVS